MRHVDLENIILPGARQMEITVPFERLAGSLTDLPLYATIDREGGKLAVLSVDLERADLPLRTAFPIMMTNALAWYSGQQGELREALPAGSVVEIDLAETRRRPVASHPAADEAAPAESAAQMPAEPLVLVSPTGQKLSVPENVERTSLGPLDECGIWSLQRAAERESVSGQDGRTTNIDQYAVNLASREESDIRSAEQAGGGPVMMAGFGGRPLWFYLAAVGLVLTTLEWYLYQRRWIA